MKTTVCLLAAVVLATSASLACECKDAKKDGKADSSKAKKPKTTGVVEKGTITGSYIPREVRRNGQVTDGVSHVAVLDQDTIRNSGASDLRDLLVRRGGFR